MERCRWLDAQKDFVVAGATDLMWLVRGGRLLGQGLVGVKFHGGPGRPPRLSLPDSSAMICRGTEPSGR